MAKFSGRNLAIMAAADAMSEPPTYAKVKRSYQGSHLRVERNLKGRAAKPAICIPAPSSRRNLRGGGSYHHEALMRNLQFGRPLLYDCRRAGGEKPYNHPLYAEAKQTIS